MSDKNLESLQLLSKMAAHLSKEVVALSKEVVEKGKLDRKRGYRGSVRVTIFLRDGGKCFYCGKFVDQMNFHVDHVIPYCLGGRTIVENGVASCPPCNLKKGKKVW